MLGKVLDRSMCSVIRSLCLCLRSLHSIYIHIYYVENGDRDKENYIYYVENGDRDKENVLQNR